MPEGESLATKDTNKLLLTAHERTRLEGMLNRAETRGKGPFKRSPQDILKAEYARGFAEGGPSGGAVCRAVVGIARDFGLDLNAIVDEHRRDSHHSCLEDAQAARMRANMVGRSVPKPPFPHPRQLEQEGSGERVGAYTNRRRGFVPKGNKLFRDKPRRPSWK